MGPESRTKPAAVQPRKAVEMAVAPMAETCAVLTLAHMARADALVAFKVKVTAPRRFRVKPVAGVLLPNQSVPVVVEHVAMPAVGLARAMANGHDQILVQCCTVPPACGSDPAALNAAWAEAERHRGRVGIGLAESVRKVVLRWDNRRANHEDISAWESHARQADAIAGGAAPTDDAFTTPVRQPLLPREAPNVPPSFLEAQCDAEGSAACTICLDAAPDALAWPCGHAGTCFRCLLAHFAHNGRRCPLCRMQVEAIERNAAAPKPNRPSELQEQYAYG